MGLGEGGGENERVAGRMAFGLHQGHEGFNAGSAISKGKIRTAL